jgi:hypothetical protein
MTGDDTMADPKSRSNNARSRRFFLKNSLAAGAAGAGISLATNHRTLLARDEDQDGRLTKGDAALLRFAAAAEILESDFWIQYNELGGFQDSEVPGGFGNATYTMKLENLDEDFPQYIHDNTDDEITHTAAFHMPTIEQGGNSLYPSLAQRATSVAVLRILISIGPTETMHFQTWSDKAGAAVSPPLAPLTDPTNGLMFPNLDSPAVGETFTPNLIMPEPCPFISRKLPKCSVIRPTETRGVAMGTLAFLTAMGLFIGQSPAFFEMMRDLAAAADAARRGDD